MSEPKLYYPTSFLGKISPLLIEAALFTSFHCTFVKARSEQPSYQLTLMASSGDQQPEYHGGNQNPDQEKYRRYLDELDDLFPCEDAPPAVTTSNNSKFESET